MKWAFILLVGLLSFAPQDLAQIFRLPSVTVVPLDRDADADADADADPARRGHPPER